MFCPVCKAPAFQISIEPNDNTLIVLDGEEIVDTDLSQFDCADDTDHVFFMNVEEAGCNV